jgi:hypothetical protein
MKTFITVCSFLFASSFAFACDQQEMQFMGKATHVNHHRFNLNSRQICTYEIELTMANSSVTCPLVEGEVAGIRFVDSNCLLQEGSNISGVIVRKNSTFWVE